MACAWQELLDQPAFFLVREEKSSPAFFLLTAGVWF
jgi:hypothetical protein